METPNDSGASAVAIAAATAGDALAPAPMTPEQEAELAAAQAKAAELIKLPIDKLKKALAGLSIFELARVLEAEKAEGEGKTRTGALEVIEAAAAKLAEEKAEALAPAGDPAAQPPASMDESADGDRAQPPASMPAATAPVDGGPIELEGAEAALALDAGLPLSASDAIAAAVVGAGEDAGVVAALEELGVRVIRFDDETAEWDNAEVLAHVLDAGAILVIARRDFAHEELTPIRATPDQFVRAHDGQRVLFTGLIELSGVGLASPLPLEEVWLVFPTEDGPMIVRRCEVPGALYLEPGRVVQFRPRTLIF